MLIKNEFVNEKKLEEKLGEFHKVYACEPHGTSKAIWANYLGQYRVFKNGITLVWEGSDYKTVIEKYEEIEIVLKPNSNLKNYE